MSFSNGKASPFFKIVLSFILIYSPVNVQKVKKQSVTNRIFNLRGVNWASRMDVRYARARRVELISRLFSLFSVSSLSYFMLGPTKRVSDSKILISSNVRPSCKYSGE